MELLDYARFRWKSLTILFLLGLLAIAAVASGRLTTTGQYTAQTELLIRPPASQLNAFNYDLDRYINTEIATIESQAGLQSEAKGTSFSSQQLGDALTSSHDSGTDVATLSVRTGDRARSVSLVNHVAETYLKDAQRRGLQSSQRSIDYLQGLVNEQQTNLQQASAELARAYRARAGGANAASVDPSLLSPDAYSKQQIAIASLPQLQQQLVDLRVTARSSISSLVLNKAKTASATVSPWRPSTIAAAVAGLFLLLVALVAIAISLSTRVISVARWDNVTADSRLRPAVRGRPRRRQRAADLRRVVAGISNTGLPGSVSIVPFPTATRRTRRTTSSLVQQLDSAEVSAHAEESLSPRASHQNGTSAEAGPVLVVVDLAACRVEDAAVLADTNPSTLHRIVPVLV